MKYSQPNNKTMVLHVIEPADPTLREKPVHVFSAPSWFDARAVATTAWPRGWYPHVDGKRTDAHPVVLDPFSQVEVEWRTIEVADLEAATGRDYVVHWIDPHEELRQGFPSEYLEAKAGEPVVVARMRVRDLERELAQARAYLTRLMAERRQGGQRRSDRRVRTSSAKGEAVGEAAVAKPAGGSSSRARPR